MTRGIEERGPKFNLANLGEKIVRIHARLLPDQQVEAIEDKLGYEIRLFQHNGPTGGNILTYVRMTDKTPAGVILSARAYGSIIEMIRAYTIPFPAKELGERKL